MRKMNCFFINLLEPFLLLIVSEFFMMVSDSMDVFNTFYFCTVSINQWGNGVNKGHTYYYD